MSPEQASGDPHLDHRTDIYSLSVVGYHMLTGAVPFEGDSTRAILFKQMMESPRSMRELVPEVPEGLMAAVSKGMAKEAAERYPTIEAFEKAIEATAVDEQEKAAAATAASHRKPRRALWGLGAAAALAITALVVALGRKSPSTESPQVVAAGTTGQVGVTPPVSPDSGRAGVIPPGTAAPSPAPPPTPVPVTSSTDKTEKKKPAANVAANPKSATPVVPPTTGAAPTCSAAAGGDDRDLAFRVCTQEAEKGNVVSERLLAQLYDKSQVPGHDAEAVTWYRKAADAGDLPSLLRYGLLLHLGKGIPLNELDATAKIRQAAEADYQPAWTVLAERFELGLGTRRSDQEAFYWYKKAAEKGDVAAQAKVGDMYARGKGINKDEAEAVKWFRQAAEKGNRDAQYGLGMAYLRGKGIQKSDSLAYDWLKKSADAGHVEAKKEVAKRKT
jgi:TPR repeat protein